MILLLSKSLIFELFLYLQISFHCFVSQSITQKTSTGPLLCYVWVKFKVVGSSSHVSTVVIPTTILVHIPFTQYIVEENLLSLGFYNRWMEDKYAILVHNFPQVQQQTFKRKPMIVYLSCHKVTEKKHNRLSIKKQQINRKPMTVYLSYSKLTYNKLTEIVFLSCHKITEIKHNRLFIKKQINRKTWSFTLS